MNSEERELLLDAAERWFKANNTFEDRVATFRKGHHEQPGAWDSLAEMGWLALTLPESAGGFEAGYATALALLACAGKHARPEPLGVHLMLCDLVALRLPDTAEPLAQGVMRLGFADLSPRIERRLDIGLQGTLSGGTGPVWGAEFATHFLVPVMQSESGLRLALVAADDPGLATAPVRLVDARAAAELRFDSAQIQWLDDGGSGAAGQRALDLGAVAMVADAAGVFQAAFDLTHEYLLQRIQFGRPLSAQQAVQHKMAEIFCDLQQMLALEERLGMEVDSAPAGFWPTLSTAKCFVGRRALRAVGQLIQLSGGVGVTEEYKLTHYYRRLHVAASLYGTAESHLARIGPRTTLLAA